METALKTHPGRPRAFDEAQVLDAALEAFWEKGYEGTSVADLVRVTGLHKGSLYQAFGDKRSLFLRALQRYSDHYFAKVLACIEAGETPLQKLELLLSRLIDLASGKEGPCKGCFAVNTLAEMAEQDEDIGAIMTQGYTRRVDLISSLIAAAQSQGQLQDSIAPERLTLILMTLTMGFATGMKGPMDESTAKELLMETLAAWK